MTDNRDGSAGSSGLELVVSEDRMSVKVKNYSPPPGTQSNLSLEDIYAELARLDVLLKPDEGLLNNILLRSWSGSPIKDMTIMTGIMPRKKGASFFEPRGNLSLPVFKGTLIGVYARAEQDQSGKNVFGRPVPPHKLDQEYYQEMVLGSGCKLDSKSGGVLAKGYGLVQMDPGKIDVKPLFRIVGEKSRIVSIIFPRDYYELEIQIEQLLKALTDMKVAESMVEQNAIETALENAHKTQSPQIAVVARGTPAKYGRNGYFELASSLQQEEVDDSDVTRRVDYRERSVYRSVAEGTVLGRIHQATPGRDGQDVFGNVIPGRDGKECPLGPGENVRLDPSTGELVAESAGLVLFQEKQVSVLDFLQVNGDVALSTGNIKLNKGSLEVMGTVRDTFSVRCPEHLIVHKNIEDAQVLAGGNIEVQGGVVMKGSGYIKVKGSLRCKFAENANIMAVGQVSFANNLTNCTVVCKDRVVSQGKGKVMGGKITAEKGMEVRELGSSYGVRTEVNIGLVPEELQSLLDQKKELKKHKDEINKKISSFDLKKSTPEQKKVIKEIMNVYSTIQERLLETERQLEEKREEFKKSTSLVLKVTDTVYPGTVITISGKTVQVQKEQKACKFYYDPVEDRVAWS
ncbi:protein of unknown function DUF342 [Desulfonatronospira thiodismutans ASO3-1]|uniref:Flagellar Assembly Protein A N-terminal region domain-containing protein n=1 Tax=Desulfonatronospira thiodismutans ASO3-1 TaxID=555779 RepID=D6ST43_9BACT|nr:FapA family protein [Desulfonatronospira thiodismutans]EFI33859.1 protein of unknown function DUF342 [Desulfonatronospira thiodismutans ASO3-1]